MGRLKLDPDRKVEGATDWRAVDRLSDRDVKTAASRDPDARPLTASELERMHPAPDVNRVLRKLGVSASEFAEIFGLPRSTIEKWQKRTALPNPIEKSFLLLIENNPDLVEPLLWRTVRSTKTDSPETTGATYHVLPDKEGWVVRKVGSKRSSGVYRTQKSALEAVRKRFSRSVAELVIHGKDGRVRRRLSYHGSNGGTV